jgi:hypothetical protein
MVAVLTAASALVCPHQAPLTVQASQRQLVVDGQPVLVRADLLAATVSGCPNTGPGLKPCTLVTNIAAGLAVTLRVGAEPVALETAYGATDAVPQPAFWRVTAANQTKLEAT